MSRPPVMGDQLTRFIDATEDPVLVLDRDGTVLQANGPAATALRRPLGELLGAPLADVVDARHGRVRAAIGAAWESGHPQRTDSFSSVLDGWYHIEVVPIGDRLLMRFWDVSQRRRDALTRELRDQLATAVVGASGPDDALVRAANTLRELPDVDVLEVLASAPELPGARVVHRWSRHDGIGDRWWSREAERTWDLDVPRAVTAPDAGTEVRSGVLVPIAVPGRDPACLVVATLAAPPELDHLAVLREVHRDLVSSLVRQQERRDLSRLFHLSSELLAVVRRDGTFARVNPALAALAGLPEEALLGRLVADFVHADDVQLVAGVLDRTIRGDAPGQLTHRAVTASGEVRRLWWSVDADRAEGVAYITGRDVTEQERDNALVTAQRDVLRKLASGAELSRVLRALCQALEARLPGTRVLVEPTEAGRTFGVPVVDEHAGPGTGPHADADDGVWSLPLIASDRQRLGTLTVRRDRAGGLDVRERELARGVAGVARLALERDRDAVRLRTSEERFRLLAKATSDAVWDLDLSTGHLWWGDGFEQLFGHDREQLGADLRSWSRRIHPDDRHEVLANAAAALEGGAATWSDTYRFLRADGSTAHVLDRALILRDEEGNAIRMVGGMVDRTEQEELQQQYLRAQRMESVGTLAGGIAHDLNNALAPIVMAAELLDDPRLDGDQAELVRTIEESARHGTEVVRQVLTFARGVAGERAPVAARPLLEGLTRMVADTFPKDLRTEVEVVGDPVLLGDAVQLQQVLLNLALNARDAMPRGGRLRLRADETEVDESYAAMRSDARVGRYVRLTVTDTGAGIRGEDLPRVTEPFFSTKAPSEGSGLGLSTASAIVEGHGGYLDVVSEVGRGTTVKVHLPAAPEVGDRPEVADGGSAPAPDRPSPGAGRLVLVADDESAVRDVTCRTLERHGWRTVSAGDGAQAVARFAQRRHEIVVVMTDLTMPVLDGIGAIAALRRLDPDLPILAVSGLADAGAAADGLPPDVPVLRKPFRAETLLRELDRLLGDRAAP